MPKVIKIDHIAVLVDDMQSSLSFWQDALGIDLAGLSEVPTEQARVAFLPTGGSEVELVQPTTADSGLARYLEKRGPGMHHICLQVDDITGMLAQLKEHGIQLINEIPRLGTGGKQYAFIHPKSAGGVMVELYQLPPETEGNAPAS
jgi:methylmalonyl-CoA/ethylmalonyl-CoA epimerase